MEWENGPRDGERPGRQDGLGGLNREEKGGSAWGDAGGGVCTEAAGGVSGLILSDDSADAEVRERAGETP